jgi:hypothetical protein
MELVTIDSKKILLNSRMEELSFSKTNYDSVVTQSGLLAVSKNSPDGKYDFTFSEWRFNDVLALETEGHKNRVVHYSGTNPLSSKAKTFLTIAEGNDYFDAGFAICSMLTQAALEKVNVPLVGAGGIIVDISKTETRLLFIPEDLYKFSAGGLSDAEFTRIQAQWLNLTIYDLPAVCFMRAVIAYKIITGKMPYTATDPLERNADLLDHKFTPVNYIINGINKELSYAINKALKLNANVVKEPGKKKKGKDVEDLTPTPEFPLELLKDSKIISDKEKLPEEEFSVSVQNFKKRQASRIKFRRFLRRNKVAIIVGILAIVVGIFIGINTYSSNMDHYTAKGQTAKEVFQIYCMSINSKDSILMDDVSKGKTVEKQNDAVSSVFVIGKMRQQYGVDSGYEDPSEWFLSVSGNESYFLHSVYGITNLYIDGEYCDMNINIKKKIDKPEPVKFEDGKEVKDGDVKTLNIEYDLLYTNPDEFEILITHIKGKTELTFHKDQWYVSDLDFNEDASVITAEEYLTEFNKAFAENEKDHFKTADALRKIYPWIPSVSNLKRAQEKMIRDYMELSIISPVENDQK